MKQKFIKFKQKLESKLKNIVSIPHGKEGGVEDDEEGMEEALDDTAGGDEYIDRVDALPASASLEIQVSSALEGTANVAPFVLLLNALTSRGKKLGDWIKDHDTATYSSSLSISNLPYKHVLVTSGSGEVLVTIKALVSQ